MLTLPALARRSRQDADDWQRTDGGMWLPRVPLRGGIVRRGMGHGFEPAGCCCEVEGCVDPCSGTVPSTVQVDVEGVGYGACSNAECDVLNGTYVLSRVPGQFAWSLSLWSPLNEIVICSSPYQNILQSITISVTCEEPGTYYAECHFAFSAVGKYAFLFFRSATQNTPFDCSAFSGLVCDFVATKPDGTGDWICQGGTATVTAL